jgi:hypothetical protein
MGRATVVGLAVFVVAVIAFATSIGKAQGERRITGTYTDMYYNDEGGDLLGEELKIVYTDKGYQGALQFADGGAGPLIIVNIRIDGDKIAFTVPDSSPDASFFSGTIKDGVIHGEFDYKAGGVETVTLKKGKSYWD